jgi:hypothetical protein
MMPKSVLLDTSFFIRFLNESDPLFSNAEGYFKYFLHNEIVMMISTISIAEYCVRGDISELPLKNLQIVPFNLDHAKRTGEFAGFVFDHKKSLDLKSRHIIPNDSKLFAQADKIQSVDYYLSSDVKSLDIYNLLKESFNPRFHFLNLNNTYQQSFGLLDL